MDIKGREISVITVEEDPFLNIKEEETSVVKLEEEMLVDTKEEDFCGDVNSPTIKVEKDRVNYICVSRLLDTFYKYPILWTIIYCRSLSLCLCEKIKQLHCIECKHFCQNLILRSSSIYPHCNDYAAL